MSRYVRLMPIVFAVLAVLPALVNARPQNALPPPHLGYGLNVWDQPGLAAPLGFEWIKLVQEAGPPPTTRLPENVLYRITIEGDPDKLAQYPEQIRALVRSARGKVDAYEIGNEPNLKGAGFWGNFDVDIEAYTRLLCTVYPIIKSEDPNAIVVTGGLAPVGRWPAGSKKAVDERFFAMRMFDWIKYLNNGQMCADAFGYHPYGFKYEPERPLDQLDPSDNGNGFAFRGAEVMHDIMVQFGAGNLQIWATEVGWIRDPVADPWTFSPAYTDYSFCNEIVNHPEMAGFLWMQVTAQQQADYTVRAFQYADQNWPWMGPMFVWNLDYYHRGTSCTPHKFFSLYQATEGIIAQRAPAPVYTALQTMPRRSAWAGDVLSVMPDRVSFQVVRGSSRPLTAAVSIASGHTSVAWRTTFVSPLPPGLTVSPISGTTPGSMIVSADPSLFQSVGTSAFTLQITADPTTTVGSPFTLPITLDVLDAWRTYLPIIRRSSSVPPTPTPTPPPAPITPTTRFGAVFITSAEAPADEARYQKSLATGAGMDRWPLYWPGVETSEGSFVWNSPEHQVDRAVISDTAHGIQPLVILMNTPGFYSTGGNQLLPMPRVGQLSQMMMSGLGVNGPSSVSAAGSPPVRLYEPVFADGTDTPGIAKTINANNPWARFVYQAVNRYKPGGVLAQQLGWPAGRGVRHWEIWNEEDYTGFWIGTYTDYARLLKVAYLAAKHADPQAKIIFGGLANIDPNSNWLQDTLSVINTYPDKDANGWFFDAVAEHNYVNAWNTFNYMFRATQSLKTYTITNKSLWVTESNVWLCGDGPITPPCFHEDGSPVEYRANLDEQAAFVIQSATYATWMNYVVPVEAIFHFQMYDDCVDPIPGTTWGGGLGLVRNPTGWGCFVSWMPDTLRPAYAAFQTAIAHLRDASPRWRARPQPTLEMFSFYRAPTQERVMAMWARGYVTETAVFTATGTSARLVWPSGAAQVITPTNGVYTVTLPAATSHAAWTSDGSAPIGGRPYFWVESDPAGTGGPRP